MPSFDFATIIPVATASLRAGMPVMLQGNHGIGKSQICYQIGENLGHLARDYGTRHPSHDLADQTCARLDGATIEDVFDEGLHEFLSASITDTAELAQRIETDFRFYQ